MEQTNKIDLKTLPSIKCECGNEYWRKVCVLKEVPGMLVGLGSETIAYPVPQFQCTKCGKVLDPDEEYERMNNKKASSGLII